MNAPGSPSSALQSTYFTSPLALRVNSHFMPVENPAPPRPRRPDFFTSSTTCSGVISVRTFARARYPSRAMYSSILRGSMRPQLRRTIFTCRRKNGISFRPATSGAALSAARSFTTRPFNRCSSVMRAASAGFRFWYITPSG